MISLEDMARTIGEKSTQNGYTADWTWAGEALDIQFTRLDGRPGPRLSLSRNHLRQTVGKLDGKTFGPWPGDTESFAWGRFWRAVRLAGGANTPKRQDHSFARGGR